jgi:hypothetical protein
MKINRWLAMAGMAAAICVGTNVGLAQNDPGGPGGGAGGQGRGGRGNFDPAQFRERMLERTKESLEITDDAEWKAIQPLVEKVMEARMATMSGMGRGMFGGPPRRGGDNAQGGQGQRRGQFGGAPSPDAEALQRAIDGKASNAEMKAAIAKYVEARKVKQAELEKAQADLRKVLSVRQEALAVLNGLL